jgi:hypothetical protein
MAEACYMARATTKQQVLDRINKLTLQTNKHGQYTHDVIFLIQKGIQRVLVSQFYPSDPGKGMVKLLDDGDNILTRVQSTDAITAESVLKLAKKRADALSTTTGKTILPTITAQTEAQEETDQLNDINQSVIGAKEGVVEAVSKLVGSNITDTILIRAYHFYMAPRSNTQHRNRLHLCSTTRSNASFNKYGANSYSLAEQWTAPYIARSAPSHPNHQNQPQI